MSEGGVIMREMCWLGVGLEDDVDLWSFVCSNRFFQLRDVVDVVKVEELRVRLRTGLLIPEAKALKWFVRFPYSSTNNDA